MKKIPKYLENFVSTEERTFKFRVGKMLASSLSGFIAGVIFASIVWVGTIILLNMYNSI
ncbi:MAG: hypothetical protein WD883_02965 [Candidatus Colwellbacteria bacterium]